MTKWITKPKYVSAAGRWCVTGCTRDKEKVIQHQEWFDTEEKALEFYQKEKPNYE